MANATPQKMSLHIPQATPTRDRSQPLRSDGGSSQYSSPTTTRTTNQPGTSPNPSAPAVSIVPLTVDGVLSQHASASNPPLASLESVVLDRNTLASQNAQLWKLIEKQRSGYSQLMKELERVRGERDVFRSKLHSMGETTDGLLKAHREKEKREGKESLRSTASHTHLRTSESSGSNGAIVDPRGTMSRTQSDDNSVRSGTRSTNTAREGVVNGRERQNSQSSLYANHSSSQLSSVYLTPSHTSSTTNLSTSPTTSIPQSASSSTVSLIDRPPADAIRKPSPLQIATSRADSLPSAVLSTPGTSSAALNPGSSSTGSSARSADALNQEPWNSSYSARSATHQTSRPNPPSSTILFTPATPGVSGLSSNAAGRTYGGEKAAASPRAGSLDNSDLPRPDLRSRESRVSLPEEAKRYYASMGDSPLASPHLAQNPNANSPPIVQLSNGDRISESPPPLNGHSSKLAYAKSSEENGEFLELDDEDSAYGSNAGEEPNDNADDDDEADDMQQVPGKSRAAADDFPLPPSSPPMAGGDTLSQSQMQSITIQRMQSGRSQDDAQSQYSLSSTAVTSDSRSLLDPNSTQLAPVPLSPVPIAPLEPSKKFRALPLLPADLAQTLITVSHCSIRANDRGKEVLSFVVIVQPSSKDPWKVEKLYSDVLALDSRVRTVLSKSMIKRLASLPEGKLWKDHAPAKVDQRKDALEQYLRSLINLHAKNTTEIIAFLTSDVVREAQKPISQPGYKEGYLTKRGKNFGGWKTRYFVLQGPSLEYYESRGGTHLGSIVITGAQIGRQQRTIDSKQPEEENEYRHAFLIIEARKGPGGSNPRHVLCATNDHERDTWVEELVRYVSGAYNDEEGSVQDEASSQTIVGRSSTSSDLPVPVTPSRRPRKDDISKGPALPISQLPPDANNAKLFQTAPTDESASPVKTGGPQSYAEHRAATTGIETPLSTSLPSTSPLAGGSEDVDIYSAFSQRATSEMGHYPDLTDQRAEFPKVKVGRSSPEDRRRDKRRSLNPLRSTSIPERDGSPEKEMDPNTPRVDAHGKVKISGPMNGTPIPAGYKFGGKDAPAEPTSNNDRREKAKSRTFWGFGRHEKPNLPVQAPRAVFGISLEESLDVAQIAGLPAIVFRCIQYLEATKAEQEEGIYRLSGSSAVIKALKDRFNTEGDVDLLAPEEYWDPHAISGLLKTFLRELPASILTRDLHLRFLSVIDFVDPQERIAELTHLIASLPVANYSLLRALTAHLILIVQNANVNKMTMRNVGIVFSPTLGIPAGVFSLMLGEFNRVFNVDGSLGDEEGEGAAGEEDPSAELNRRNSRHYSDAAADKLLGLSGRVLSASAEDGQSDDDEDASIPEESGTEDTAEQESVADLSATSNPVYLGHQPSQSSLLHPSDRTQDQGNSSTRSHASSVAASRGLNITTATDKASRRQSRMVGLPHSPRPPHGPPSNSSPRPPSTPRGGSAPHSPFPPSTPK
ncbi:hypothetical protein EIP91_010814 [Steccherinum ochraceum]|uniref:RhoGAP-domain-containing protein n=1 Tax=Steccherinum ochraceum TaxID=92696 RepID=A0A4R0RMZ5_9APHY|nr:hypothetical protein EIP91_010814 [Steccherinum ochraceum]